MPRGRFGITDERRQQLKAIASQGGEAAARVHKDKARARLQQIVAGLTDKWAVWPIAWRAGYKAGASAGYRRGLAEARES